MVEGQCVDGTSLLFHFSFLIMQEVALNLHCDIDSTSNQCS